MKSKPITRASLVRALKRCDPQNDGFDKVMNTLQENCWLRGYLEGIHTTFNGNLGSEEQISEIIWHVKHLDESVFIKYIQLTSHT